MKRKICINLIYGFSEDYKYLLNIIKEVGYDGVSIDWKRDYDFMPLVEEIRHHNLHIEYIHAPFYRVCELWEEDSQIADDVINELKECILFAHQIKVDKVVAHVYIGFDKHSPSSIGVKRFEEVLDFAKEYNINICFENVEGEEYLEYLTKEVYSKYDNAGFCLDTGHEMCYNRSKDQLALYGNKLLCTHINDNLGVTKENITFLDDLHYIPGDGKLDIENLINRLNKCNYQGNVTFELKITHQFDTEIYEKYRTMGAKKYYVEVYKIGEKIRDSLRG